MKKYYITILCGLFIAMQVVLKRLTAVDLGFVRINFEFLPIALGGAVFGPLWNGLVCVAADIISFLIVPGQGAFMPGFTLSALLKGLAYGFFLRSALPFVDGAAPRPVQAVRNGDSPNGVPTPGDGAGPRLVQAARIGDSPNGVPASGDDAPLRPIQAALIGDSPNGVPASGDGAPPSDFVPGDAARINGAVRAKPLSTARSLLIRTSVAAFCVTILIEALLNTLWVAMLYNEAYTFYLGSRFIKSLIMLPVHVVLFGLIWRPLGKYVESAVLPKISPSGHI